MVLQQHHGLVIWHVFQHFEEGLWLGSIDFRGSWGRSLQLRNCRRSRWSRPDSETGATGQYPRRLHSHWGAYFGLMRVSGLENSVEDLKIWWLFTGTWAISWGMFGFVCWRVDLWMCKDSGLILHCLFHSLSICWGNPGSIRCLPHTAEGHAVAAVGCHFTCEWKSGGVTCSIGGSVDAIRWGLLQRSHGRAPP